MYDAAIPSCVMVLASGTLIAVWPSSCQASRAATSLLAGQAFALCPQGLSCSLQASNAQMTVQELVCFARNNILLCVFKEAGVSRAGLFWHCHLHRQACMGCSVPIHASTVSATSLITDFLPVQADIFSPVRTYLDRLWSLWEMMLLAKPIMVVAPTPGNSQRAANGLCY